MSQSVSNLTNDVKKQILHDINLRLGGDINDLNTVTDFQTELILRREHLTSCVNLVNSEVPGKISSAFMKADECAKHIQVLKEQGDEYRQKVEDYLEKTEPLNLELEKRLTAINKLEQVLAYLKSYEKVEELSRQLKQSNDDEQLVQLYGELKLMYKTHKHGHRTTYIKEHMHYWHNILKDKITKHYEEVLKLIKWPFTSGAEQTLPPKEISVKFNNLTRYLFLIQEPEDDDADKLSDSEQEPEPSLPIKVLLRPLKKRFAFHFTGNRQTARVDRPEWFLTQTLTWIRDHDAFVKTQVQPIADKLGMKKVRAVDEFNHGLLTLAAERLHAALSAYHARSKGAADADAAFAHAVDETLGFTREVATLTGSDAREVLAELTRAETFVRWLAVEKKYALIKMDETLSGDGWWAPVGASVGALAWVPRAADWFATLLNTIEDRYAALPQPGHRLQFLELQLELIEEWRVRLTQLQSAATSSLDIDSYLAEHSSQPLAAVANAAHHTHTTLLEWAHSLHYLQLHYYQRQFQHFTQLQHQDSDTGSSSSDKEEDDPLSLSEVEARAKRLAMNEVFRRDSMVKEILSYDATRSAGGEAGEAEQAGVFGDGPALLARLRDAGLRTLADHIMFEFKAQAHDYGKQKWHALPVAEQTALCPSPALCAPLCGLCARLAAVSARLAPPLAARLQRQLAERLDDHLLESVVLQNWFNTGGTLQLTHDVRRCLLPAFATRDQPASPACLPKVMEACRLLNLDYEDALRLRAPGGAGEPGPLTPEQVARVLAQRTDLQTSRQASVLDLF